MVTYFITYYFSIIKRSINIFVLKPQYQASTQILVNQKGSENVGVQEVQGNIQLVNTYAEILKVHVS